jgi:hypothetical protein
LQANQVNKQSCRLKKNQPKLTSCAIIEGYKPTNAIRLQSLYEAMTLLIFWKYLIVTRHIGGVCQLTPVITSPFRKRSLRKMAIGFLLVMDIAMS